MPNSKISALTSATTPLAGTETLPVVQSSTTKQVSVTNLTAGRVVPGLGFAATSSGNTEISSTASAGTPILTLIGVASSQPLIGYLGSGGIRIGSVTGLGAAGFTRQYLLDGNLTVDTGNFVPGTAAKGINFTANTPAAGKTSQLLNWYEEGTFTPTLLFGGGNTGQTGSYLGTYTRIGRIVTFAVNIGITTIGSSTGTTTITGLPFTTAAYPNPSVSLFAQYDGQIINIFAYLPASSSTLTLYNTTTGAAITQLNFTAGTSFIRVTGSYTV